MPSFENRNWEYESGGSGRDGLPMRKLSGVRDSTVSLTHGSGVMGRLLREASTWVSIVVNSLNVSYASPITCLRWVFIPLTAASQSPPNEVYARVWTSILCSALCRIQRLGLVISDSGRNQWLVAVLKQLQQSWCHDGSKLKMVFLYVRWIVGAWQWMHR